MKKIHRVWALLLAALMAIGLMTTAFAATDSAPIIDPGKKASLSIYKYDITTAGNDGAWDAESYVSTGLHDDAVIDKLSKYAIQGVEFTYLRVECIILSVNDTYMDAQEVMHMTDYSKITALYSRLSVGDEDRDGGESNSIQNQELICKGWFLPPNTYDCGSFVVNGTAVVGKE